MYLVFDTETTGLIEKGATFKPLKGFPRIVQIAWNVYSKEGVLISTQSHIIKPKGFKIPKTASKVHGITTKEALKYGVDSKYVMRLFNNSVNKASVLLAHNFRFDSKIVMSESIINDQYCSIFSKEKEVIDTMLRYKKFVGVKFSNGAYRFPTLKDLYFKVFGEHFKNAHNATADVEATAKCYFKLK